MTTVQFNIPFDAVVDALRLWTLSNSGNCLIYLMTCCLNRRKMPLSMTRRLWPKLRKPGRHIETVTIRPFKNMQLAS